MEVLRKETCQNTPHKSKYKYGLEYWMFEAQTKNSVCKALNRTLETWGCLVNIDRLIDTTNQPARQPAIYIRFTRHITSIITEGFPSKRKMFEGKQQRLLKTIFITLLNFNIAVMFFKCSWRTIMQISTWRSLQMKNCFFRDRKTKKIF